MKPLTNSLTRLDQRLLMAGHPVVLGVLALAALSFAGAANARDNVTFSVGIGLPGVVLGATNAYPVYSQPQPVYVQPAPVYYPAAPIFYPPAPVYYQQAPAYYSRPPVYVVPQPVYVGRPPGWYGHPHRRHDEHRGGYYPSATQSYGAAYGQVYYQR